MIYGKPASRINNHGSFGNMQSCYSGYYERKRGIRETGVVRSTEDYVHATCKRRFGVRCCPQCEH